MAVEQTLILIKPDAVRRRLAAEILGRIEARGFEIREGKLLTASRELGEEHYAEHREKPFFGELVDFITSGPTWALVVEGEGAIATMRSTIGATDPANAAPGTIRGDLARLDAGQPRARLRLARVGRARDRALVLVTHPNVEALDARERGVHGRARRGARGPGRRSDWGIWRVPESELDALPDVTGKDVVELGCGTAYFGAWLKKLGAARVVGVDPTPAQLATARRCKREVRARVRVRRGVGRGRAAARRVVRHRLLRVRRLDLGRPVQVDSRGGAAAAARRRARLPPQLDARAPLRARRSRTRRRARRCSGRSSGCTVRSGRDSGIEYHLAHGDWIRLLRANGFEIVDLIEIQAPADAATHERYAYVTAEWARQWPAEEIWQARLQPRSS